MGRATFYQNRLLKAPSNLPLNTAREGAMFGPLYKFSGNPLSVTEEMNFPQVNTPSEQKHICFNSACNCLAKKDTLGALASNPGLAFPAALFYLLPVYSFNFPLNYKCLKYQQ